MCGARLVYKGAVAGLSELYEELTRPGSKPL